MDLFSHRACGRSGWDGLLLRQTSEFGSPRGCRSGSAWIPCGAAFNPEARRWNAASKARRHR